jgi:hypothetical protein
MIKGQCFVVMLLHSMLLCYMILYPLLSSHYDLSYLIIIFLIVGHWMLFNNECVLSYLEKKCFDPKYLLGKNGQNKFYDYFFFRRRMWFMSLFFLSLLIVSARNWAAGNTVNISLSMICWTFIALSYGIMSSS